MKTATWFHCQLKPISRSAGKSVVNCAAYRTGSKLEDEHYGQTRDYTHKKDVVTSFTVAPDGAPEWAGDTETLWNAVEKKENRKNSILAYEWEVALPNELDDAHRENIARDIAGWLKDEYGAAVTVGIHNGGDRGNGLNDHAHIFMTTREITEDGWAKNKLRDFNVRPGQDNPEVDHVREQVAAFINTGLEDAGSDERVTHESYAARGIDIEGTKHLGPKASALERDGVETERAAINREIIEARLVWQREQAQPEITAELAREFAGRFGEDFTPPLDDDAPSASGDAPTSPHEEAPEIPPDRQEAPHGTPPDWVEAPQGTPPDWEDAPQGTPPDWVEAVSANADAGQPAPRGSGQDWQTPAAGQASDRRAEHTAWENLASRVRSYWQHLDLFLHDESSGTPAQQPEAQAPVARVAPDADSETNKSWVARVMESKAAHAATRLLHGWGHRDGTEFTAGLKDTAAIVEDILAKGSQRAGGSNPDETKQPDDPTPQTDDKAKQPELAPRPTLGMSAFEKFAASVDTSKLQPRGKTVSAFDALMARQAGQQPGASPSAPEPEPDGMTPEH